MSVINTSSVMRVFEALQERVDTVLAKLGQREQAKKVVQALLLGYLGYRVSKVRFMPRP
jgi:hypothetical protein